MRSLDLPALERAALAREEQRKLRAALAKTQWKRKRSKPGGLSTFELIDGVTPTGIMKDMTWTEMITEKRIFKDRFIKHVNDCLDKGIPTSERMKTYKLVEHWSHKKQ